MTSHRTSVTPGIPPAVHVAAAHHRFQLALMVFVAAFLITTTGQPAALEDTARHQEPSPQAADRGNRRGDLVLKERITPHWFDNNSRFWYRNDLRDGAREFILVHAESGTRKAAFDHTRLASALSRATETDHAADRLPFDRIQFADDLAAVRFQVGDVTWQCDLSSYDCARTEASLDEEARNVDEDGRSRGSRRQQRGDSERSPDGNWSAFVREHNVFLRKSNGDESEIQLSDDGREGFAYGRLSWSPDSRTLVAFRIEPGDRKEVYLIESSPEGGGRAKLRTGSYDLPGDKLATHELNLFDVGTRAQIKPHVDRFEHGWLSPRPRWSGDGTTFTYEQTDRGHQRFRLIEITADTGAVRNLIDEKTDTFIWTVHTENLRMDFINWLEHSDEIIYVSERDGWRHLHLIDTRSGEIKNQITKGEWVVRGIDRIDEDNRQVWFRASGMNPGQDPYFIHYYRIHFDGTGLVALTEGDGTHGIQLSPDRKYLIDTWSRVDQAPVHELRDASDGSLVCRLEEADISALEATGWEPPEVFVAKGRDGKTDIWGIINRPAGFDPDGSYPVIEDIYAGPQGSFVPKSFSSRSRYESLTDLGFVVVKMDGMGTANRSKAFHDVCWKDLKDAGFPDRIPWHQAVAKKHSWYDLDRLGIYGNSAGGQNAAGAVLFHPDFYKVAVASCGCHDNRMDKASWNEQWMGYPVGPHYSESSNIDNAHRLRGKLLLIVGELDSNVPPESTLRFADALIKAGKDFDLLVIPGGGHGMGSYGRRRMEDYFVRHLLGQDPPDRNAPTKGVSQ
jgi:dipeptidyl aminopeptidase/acylaminoacyl peptidase